MSKITRILNELNLHEVTSWDDVMTNDKYIEDTINSGEVPELHTQGYKVKYIPTGETFDLIGSNNKYVWIDKSKLKNKKSHDGSFSKTGTYMEFDDYIDLQDDEGKAILGLGSLRTDLSRAVSWQILNPKNKPVKFK